MDPRPGRGALSRPRLIAGLDLIITNGDAAGELLRRAIPRAEVLPWRDVLHEGPVPPTGTLAELTAIRAEYLADRGWGEREEIAAYLQARDRGLAHSTAFDRVVLWFEHDLYDQLQLLQILDWFSREQMNADGSLLLVQASEFLGRQTEDEIEALRALEQPVTQEQLALAADAWAAFRAPTPEPLQALLGGDLSPLPFLASAVRRMLEELPGRDGLSRSERQILRRCWRRHHHAAGSVRGGAADRAGRVHGRLELLRPARRARRSPASL